MSKAIVLLSGGIDSATCLSLALDHYDEVVPVHYQYGQQTAEFEHIQATYMARYFRNEGENVAPLVKIDYEPVFGKFAQGVASDRDTFVSEGGSLEEEDGRSTGYVPMRNLHLIATAAAIGDVQDADAIYHGMQMGDEQSYPDCRPNFRNAAQDAINASLADGEEIELRTPLINLEKTEVIQLGEDRGVPWQYTYSCYEAINTPSEPEPCGSCPACVERGEAFWEAGVDDPFGTIEAVQENAPERFNEIIDGGD
jgi:7-cyano-7-deazaguanine synthase